jgi:glycosyltransferase involved in cell wall biosynthesis
MKIALYAHHSMFEPALCLAEALSRSDEVHLLLEAPAGRWQEANFVAPTDLGPSGLVEADPLLAPHFPEETRAMWRTTASFHLVVTGARQARHPESVRLMVAVLAWIRRLGPDVLHVDDVDVSQRLALALAVSPLPCPVVVGCHDPDPHSGELDWQVKRVTRALMFSRASGYVVHHASGLEALRRRHPRLRRPTAVVRLAPYTFLRHREPAPPLLAPGAPVVLLFGRVAPYKGVEELFRVAAAVTEAVPGVRFVVAGKPVPGYTPPPPPAGASVETFYRYVRNDETAALFEQADVAVCPYTDASQSGVVLTAYAFGCPVVATDVGGLPEYVTHGKTGLVVAAGDEHALADALIRCLTEPGLLPALRAGVAEVTATGLTWGRAASELRDFYRTLAASRRRGRHLRRRG